MDKRQKVYIVGAGPGGKDFITLKGFNVLRQADIIIYDYLVERSLLDEAKEGARLVCCDSFNRLRNKNGYLKDQARINRLLVRYAKKGFRVVRLKSGDPCIFGRTSQELSALVKARVDFEIVPGVTAAQAASCFSGIPLTDRAVASSVVLVTGHRARNKISALDWKAIAGLDTIVLYMAVNNLGDIVKELAKAGLPKDTPSAVISNAGRIDSRLVVSKLSAIVRQTRDAGIKPPAIVIIGQVVKLSNGFNWFKKQRRILFTGISPERFFQRGVIFHLPLVKIVALADYRAFDSFIRKVRDYHWVIFASRFGVEYFFKRLYKNCFDARVLSGVKTAAIGSSTANRLLDFGICADLIPKEESSCGLLKEFRKIDLKGKRLFIPRSDLGGKDLNTGLADLGARVDNAACYRNIPADNLPDLDLGVFDEVIFTSPSVVRSFKARYKKLPGNLKVSCIGEVTHREMLRCRLLN